MRFAAALTLLPLVWIPVGREIPAVAVALMAAALRGGNGDVGCGRHAGERLRLERARFRGYG